MKDEIMESLNNMGIMLNGNEDDDLFEYYSDSIIFMSFIIELEQTFDMEVPMEYLKVENFRCLKMIENTINEIKRHN